MFNTIGNYTGRVAQTIPSKMEFLVDGAGDLLKLSKNLSALV